jgi:hypothetical protein
MRRRVLSVAAVLACAAAGWPAAASAQGLTAGAGRADITPQTGYYLGGWTRADRVAGGQHTRLYSRALVLERGGRKVALVSVDLFMIPGGLTQQIGNGLRDRGFSEQNVLISASHTHSGPGGYGNYPTLNTAAPSLQTAVDPLSFYRFLAPSPADPQLYTFLFKQITEAIVRADRDRAPAAAAWGSERIVGLTRNRSVEAHLANHGILLERGEGTDAMDPDGPVHTIDPDVNVLRVDKVVRRRAKGGRRHTVHVPIGGWSTFADHGTVTKSSFQFYNADHHASAMRGFEGFVRTRGKVGAKQEVVNVYGNSNEGDMSAGLDRDGPAASDYVGRVEADAMVRAWRAAGRSLSRTPALDLRWTRVCFCGQETEGGAVSDHSEVGLPFLTGSEEERGPLYDVTGVAFEGDRSPVENGAQGHKFSAPAGTVPNAVPLLALKIGSRVIVSIPGEGTKEVGARIKTAVEAAVAGSGVDRVVVSGLANEFVLYFTTPEEFERQHYEGGNTHFGRYSSNLVKEQLARLAGILVRGEPAPAPYPFDPANGVVPNGPPYGDGAAEATVVEQPAASYQRLGHAAMSWQGGPKGLDRPVDKAFVTAERLSGKRWVRADDDLGLAILWKVDASGRYRVIWEIPRDAPRGRHRFVVTGKRYRLTSTEFSVGSSTALVLVRREAPAGKVAVALRYPDAVRDVDLTWRPQLATGGVVRFRVGGSVVRVARKGGTDFMVDTPGDGPVFVDAGAARDRWGNTSAAAATLP